MILKCPVCNIEIHNTSESYIEFGMKVTTLRWQCQDHDLHFQFWISQDEEYGQDSLYCGDSLSTGQVEVVRVIWSDERRASTQFNIGDGSIIVYRSVDIYRFAKLSADDFKNKIKSLMLVC